MQGVPTLAGRRQVTCKVRQLYCVRPDYVVSGLVPRWVAKPPQQDRRGVSGSLW